MFDLSRLVPEAKPIVAAATTIYLQHTHPWFIGLLIHGSALKGGVIPGCSDIDFQLFLDDTAFLVPGQLPLEVCLRIYQDLSQVDPAPFRYIQCNVLSSLLPEGYIGPIPGAYHLLVGTLPVAEATRQQLRDSARKRLAMLDPVPRYMVGSLLEHGGERLAGNIRWLCTDVWPTLYQVLTLQGHDAFRVWSLPKHHAIELLSPDTRLGQTIRTFYQVVQAYYPTESSIKEALAVIQAGIAFLQTAKSWWNEHPRV